MKCVCWYTDESPRHLARLCILSLLHRLASSRWLQVGLPHHRRHPAGVFGDDGADVYLWEEGADVDGTDEHDGEVLSFASGFV